MKSQSIHFDTFGSIIYASSMLLKLIQFAGQDNDAIRSSWAYTSVFCLVFSCSLTKVIHETDHLAIHSQTWNVYERNLSITYIYMLKIDFNPCA